MNLVKPTIQLDIRTVRDESVTVYPDIWYEYKEVSSDTLHLFVPGLVWPNNVLIVKKTLFDNYFVSKDQDRDIKINNIIDNG